MMNRGDGNLLYGFFGDKQSNDQQPEGAGGDSFQLPRWPPPPPPLDCGDDVAVGGASDGESTGLITLNSMAERARLLAKEPQPAETKLKCPRCESTDTKFCYYNNYSLSQPRYFCKSCRKYWTSDSSLRNVPIGSGSTRNKRSNISKSSSKAGSGSSNGLVSNSRTDGNYKPPPFHLPPLHHLIDFNSTLTGLNFNGIQPPAIASDGGSGGGGSGGVRSIFSLIDQCRLKRVQQFPFLANLEPPNYVGPLRSKPLETGVAQLSAVKTEENPHLHQGNLSKK